MNNDHLCRFIFQNLPKVFDSNHGIKEFIINYDKVNYHFKLEEIKEEDDNFILFFYTYKVKSVWFFDYRKQRKECSEHLVQEIIEKGKVTGIISSKNLADKILMTIVFKFKDKPIRQNIESDRLKHIRYIQDQKEVLVLQV